uniref:BED-type domain-containing protein n=1 Tax=Chenopodium quinoa TaxID=63459 RepID=A0A803MIX4_CHEQI
MSTFEDDSDDLMETNSSQPVEAQDFDEAEVLEKAPKTWPKKKRAGKKKDEKGGKRKKTSNAWEHFKVIQTDPNHAKCLYCGTIIGCDPKNGTNGMNQHIDRCKKSLFYKDKSQTILDFESRTKINTDGSVQTVNVPKLWRFNHDEIRKALTKMLIVDELPFAFVEREDFRQFCKVAIPEFVPPSRATITRDCYGLFIEQRKKLKNFFNNLSSRFLHMRCAAHILNLVVKDCLKDVNVSVLKVRAGVKYVRSSPSRLQKFKSCVEEENITCKGLVYLDIETRWNSTYLMLKTALVFRKAFKNMKTKFSPYTKELMKQPVEGAPNDEDWNKIQSFLPFLEIFYNATLKLSGSRYVTGNTFVEEIYDIGYTIYDYASDPNDDIRNMEKQMKLKFDKYWANVHNINILMFIALILDPRNKLRHTEHIVRNSYDVSNSYNLCQRIQDT